MTLNLTPQSHVNENAITQVSKSKTFLTKNLPAIIGDNPHTNVRIVDDWAGWQVQDGKIVEGCEPPDLIKAHDNARFSVSGREATAVAPKGRVCYINKEKNLKAG